MKLSNKDELFESLLCKKAGLSREMAATYNPSEVESEWDSIWCESKLFTPDSERAKTLEMNEKFVIALPPPNVTGRLHLGHTLTAAIQDSLCRFHRMTGKEVLWIPGTDHAGIATQSVVERITLKEEKKTLHDFSREEFLKKIWDWKEKHGSAICSQFRRLGCSLDWSREFFTMNKPMSNAVTKAFVDLFNRGYIFRKTRLVSWSCHLRTALSDIEVDTMEVDKPTRVRVPGFEKTIEVGVLWHFSYPVQQENKSYEWHFMPENLSRIEKVTVATTRIETMLGDVAVAVHPNDGRYKSFVGKNCLHPFIKERKIVVIDDEYVDPDFGTGCVKITPAHDKNDYDIATRYNKRYQTHGVGEELEFISIFNENGEMNENCGEFSGMHRFRCREVIEKALEKIGLLVEKTPNSKPMQIPICTRSNDIVELMLKPQWWMNCKPFAERACEAVRSKKLTIEPTFHEQTWFYWLENIQDWCVSRQLLWGHRIPAYKIVMKNELKNVDEKWVAAESPEAAVKEAIRIFDLDEEFTVEQDEDVLDTWFSSGLIPFSPLGWPEFCNEKDSDYSIYFPTTLLETGSDIIFFWVARMVMLSFACTDQLPFKTVYLHAMVRDSQGRKMSKSLGNVIDPIEVIQGISLESLNGKLLEGNLPLSEINKSKENNSKDFPDGIPECGADALRIGLLAYTKQGRNINLDIKRVVAYRFFCNKIWNACKFVFSNVQLLKEHKSMDKFELLSYFDLFSIYSRDLQWEDYFITFRLMECIRTVKISFENYLFSDVVSAVYNFWLYELCDVYLELVKHRFKDIENNFNVAFTAGQILFKCIEYGLILLHPLTPFVTEELYQRIKQISTGTNSKGSISSSSYPSIFSHTELTPLKDTEFKVMMNIVLKIRSLVSILGITNKEKSSISVFILIKNCDDHIKDLITNISPQFVTRLTLISNTEIVSETYSSRIEELKSTCILDAVDERISYYLRPPNQVDLSLALKKIGKQLSSNEKLLDSYLKKKSSPAYEKVPEMIKRQNEEKIESLTSTIDTLKLAYSNIENLVDSPKQ
ncbi:valyl tRNA synthetase [Cryptosporidium ryanae]|uniref:valyl tRNA synthetase n=1 Tax=Cryptosporidium ryanae TaxID=515981 RepID=UPI00351A3AB8|nr:valyl tRNA synthetase [Cryptosporidium ryanae]